MKTIDLHVESYLFENDKGQFRSIPFYEMSMEEIIIYQNRQPKYLIDFNYRDSSFNKQIREQMAQGLEIESIIKKTGTFLGLDWSIKTEMIGKEIPDSQQIETVEIELIENFADLANELTFIATDNFITSEIIDEDSLFAKYTNEDKEGFLGIEQILIDRLENVRNLIAFIFVESFDFVPIEKNENILIYDLSKIKNSSINHSDLEQKYHDWLRISERENSMDEYGNLLGLISFIDRNIAKRKLILRVEL